MAKVTRHYLTELRELEKAATRGPWLHRSEKWAEKVYVMQIGDDEPLTVCGLDGDVYGQADGKLIAAMRNALPHLLAVAEAARRVRMEREGPATELERQLDEALDALEAP